MTKRVRVVAGFLLLVLACAGCEGNESGWARPTVEARGFVNQQAQVTVASGAAVNLSGWLQFRRNGLDDEDRLTAVHCTWTVENGSGGQVLGPDQQTIENETTLQSVGQEEELAVGPRAFQPLEPGTYTFTFECEVVAFRVSSSSTVSATDTATAQIIVTATADEVALTPDTGPHSTTVYMSGLAFEETLDLNEVHFVRAEADATAIPAAVSSLDPVQGLRVKVPQIASRDMSVPSALPDASVVRGLIDPRSPAADVDEFDVALTPVDVRVDVSVSPSGSEPLLGTGTFHYRPTRVAKELWLSQHAELDQLKERATALAGNTFYYVDRSGDTERLRRIILQPGEDPQPETLVSWDATVENAAGLALDGTKLYVALDTSETYGVPRRIAMLEVDAVAPALKTIVVNDTTAYPIYYGGIVVAGDMLYFTDPGRDYVGVVDLTAGVPEEAVFAGEILAKGDDDGIGTAARFDTPTRIVHHDGVLYVAESGRIRGIHVATKNVTLQKLSDGTPLPAAGDLAVDADGNLFLSRDGLGIDWARPGTGAWEGVETLSAQLLGMGFLDAARLLVDDRGALYSVSVGGGFIRIAME